ncbi:MAG: hypothetical protein DSZ06_04530 [Sulfurospirillum sp.]|nr:MAG: hypothetical protein DSZ06_04530 [Sulfurospirillum sp.]
MGKWFSKEKKRQILSKVLPPIIYLFITIIFFTVRKRFHLPSLVPDEPFMVAFWHGKIMLSPYIYKRLRKDPKIGVIISEHFDGAIIANTMKYYNFDTIRGSSRRGAIKALKESFRLVDRGYDIAITPDGPKGPFQSVADGIVAISQKKGMKIVAFNYKADSFWQLKSWDRFMVPKPFSRVDFYASEPFSIEGMEMDEAKALIKEKLNESI